MKKLIRSLVVLSVLFFSSCQEEIQEVGTIFCPRYYASTENTASKTVLDENNNILWSLNDRIAIFQNKSIADEYQINERFVGKTNGAFDLISSAASDGFVSYVELDGYNIACYPYNKYMSCQNGDGNIPPHSYITTDLSIPQQQSFVEGSFSKGAFPMIAISRTTALQFKNLCGLVKLQLTGKEKIKEVVFSGNNDETIVGDAIAYTYIDNKNPKLELTGEAGSSFKTITLDCGEGVQLDENVPTVFVFSLAPTVFEKGFKFSVKDTQGGVMVKSSSVRKEVVRSLASKMPVITYEKQTIDVPAENRSYEVNSNGETITIPVTTNVDFIVDIPQEASGWISKVETKALHSENIYLKIEPNTTGVERIATVSLISQDNSVSQEIQIRQKGEQILEIYTLEDLKKFRSDINGKRNNYKGYTVKVMADIDLKNEPWEPISAYYAGYDTDPYKFQGIFDGQGHTIKNLNGDETVLRTCYGLFGSICNATIKNLTVKGKIKTSSKYRESDFFNIGGIVGYTTESCAIINCKNYCNIEDTEISQLKSVGGIFGTANKSLLVENCENFGVLMTRGDCGGIGGDGAWPLGSPEITLVLKNCVNHSDFTNDFQYAYISGIFRNGLMIDCVNKGNITLKGENSNAFGIGGTECYGCINEGNLCANDYCIGISGDCFGCINYGQLEGTSDTVWGSITTPYNTAVGCISTTGISMSSQFSNHVYIAGESYGCYCETDLNRLDRSDMFNDIFCVAYVAPNLGGGNFKIVKTRAESNQFIDYLNQGIEQWNANPANKSKCNYRFVQGTDLPKLELIHK